MRALRDRTGDDSGALGAPFVGRDAELTRLGALIEELVAAAPRGRGRVVEIAGEAGIGKSLLVAHLLARARRLGARTATGAAYDVEVPRDQGPLHLLVAELLELPAATAERPIALEHRVAGRGLRAEQWPFLYHFLGIALPGPMQRLYDAMDPAARMGGYRDMLATLLASECRDQPLVLVIEDMHWADAVTLDAVETLAGLTRTQPIVLILTSRVEGAERWRHALATDLDTRVELGPLSTAAAGELAARLGAGDRTRDRLVARADGHPLLLTELARDDVDGDGGDALPGSIQGLVHARVDRLPDRDRVAIQIASVLGPRLAAATLRAILGDDAYTGAVLVDYRLLAPDGAGFRFTHALVRDAVYDSLVDDRRRALHERAAAELAATPALAAHHLDRAGSLAAAAATCVAAR
ncbi:MAG: AAA family ATPase [Kofleriaceae bacterium]|nr:AAA family ATPase [Kofleriaceae bacterium]